MLGFAITQARGSVYSLLAVVAASSCLVASHPFNDQAYLQSAVSSDQWDTRPDIDGMASMIFTSVGGLLKARPNAKHRNGHAITAAVIAPGTVLYHGRPNSNVPPGPEWLALDQELSLVFCNGDCYMLTMVATRELRLAYFDGSSAGKMAGGPMDSQDLLIWGKVNENDYYKEAERIRALCAWGEPYGIDGYVRYSHTFEVMACNFSNGFQLVSNRKIMPASKPGESLPLPYDPVDPKIPPGWKGSTRAFASITFGSLESGNWHNESPGETRIKVDYSRVFTFYDPAFPSLVAARRHQTTNEYRVANISAEDTKAARALVGDMFARKGKGSGIEWGSVVQVVVDRYGKRLELVRHILEHPGSRNVTAQAAHVRSQILTMLSPYMLTEAIHNSTSWSRSWVAPIAEDCATTLTSWAHIDMLTPQERLIKSAIDDVLHEICRVLSNIWLDAFGVEEANVEETSRLIGKWRNETNELMTWLDWSMWDVCDPACQPEEMCYMPSWPWLSGSVDSNPPDGKVPYCIPLVEPLLPFFDP